MATSDSQLIQGALIGPTFGTRFLDEHAGSIIRDPKVALVELVANAWDAGASEVKIRWFDGGSRRIEVQDDGCGLTESELRQRWAQLSYNRREEQGTTVTFPPDRPQIRRKAFGRLGKGRHGMFCFSDRYYIESAKSGKQTTWSVARQTSIQAKPFDLQLVSSSDCAPNAHGTRLWADADFPPMPVSDVIGLLGSKFIADPSFRLYVNDAPIHLEDLSGIVERIELPIDGVGVVEVALLENQEHSRTSLAQGVAWWVDKRCVGDISWKKLGGGRFTTGNTREGRRYTFIVLADNLRDWVSDDWSSLSLDAEPVRQVVGRVEEHIAQKLATFMRDQLEARKQIVIEQNAMGIAELPPSAKRQVRMFVDQLQLREPAIQEDVLSSAVAVMVNVQKARSGQLLLRDLAKLGPDDWDRLYGILRKWTMQEAELVLDELHKRLELIEALEERVNRKDTDELHDLQPLFANGLWIFGPEYESVEYASNRRLTTIVRDLLGGNHSELTTPGRRPDFVVKPDATIGFYTRDAFDDTNEVCGIEKLLIVELKRGGFCITKSETRQADDYIDQLRISSAIQVTTMVEAYVLGSTLDRAVQLADTAKSGSHDQTRVKPMTYDALLARAHARTFNLKRKIEALRRPDDMEQPVIDSEDSDNIAQFAIQAGFDSLTQ